jgi:hypothetical protein
VLCSNQLSYLAIVEGAYFGYSLFQSQPLTAGVKGFYTTIKNEKVFFMVHIIIRLVIGCLGWLAALALAAEPHFNAANELVKPDNYREWMYIGTGLTPHDKNDGEASFPEFHNVYMSRPAWEAWRASGEFADGTVLVKELLSVGETEAISGKGYFQGEFSTVAVMVKDKQRFANKPGNWGFFIYGGDSAAGAAAPAFDDAGCAQCHVDHAQKDLVFTQYYPILRQGVERAASAH